MDRKTKENIGDKNENRLLLIREPLTGLVPCCTTLLSKANLSTEISYANNVQGKLAGATHKKSSPSSFFFLSMFPHTFN